MPCDPNVTQVAVTDIVGTNGGTTNVEVCYVKVKEILEEDLFGLRIWSVFANGRYFDETKSIEFSANQYTTFNIPDCGLPGNAECAIDVIQGISSMVLGWRQF